MRLSALLARANQTAAALMLHRVIYSLGPLAVMSMVPGATGVVKHHRARGAA